MAKIAELWQLKPVQTAAKSLGAGLAVAGAFMLYRGASRAVFGSPDIEAQKALYAELPETMRTSVELLNTGDPEFVGIMARLLPFRRFSHQAYDALLLAMIAACETRLEAYQSGINAVTGGLRPTAAFKVRSSYQQIIEATRVLRAILESKLPTALEDFDEVAVDINAKVEQACSDAIQDSV
jgi:hypothetical protein